MALDELYEQLRKLREDISEFSEYLEGNETGTRQVLIDPLLRVLGWEVADPKQVRLEFGISKLDGGKKFADYALMRNDEPVAVVEAKRLHTKTLDAAVGAAMVEAVERGIKYILVTDGDQWRVYDVFKAAGIKESLIVEFSLVSDPLSVSAVNALVIWRPNLANQGGPTVPERLLFFKSDKPDPQDDDTVNTDDSTRPSLARVDHTGPRPTRIRFSDGTVSDITSWRRLYPQVVRHLVEIGKVNKAFRFEGRSRDTISTQQAIDTDPTYVDREDVGNGLWLELTRTPQNAVNDSKRILEAFGVDAATVQVSYD